MSDEFELSDEDTAHLHPSGGDPTVTVTELQCHEPVFSQATFQLQQSDDEITSTLYISLAAPTIRRETLGLFVERCSNLELVLRVINQAMAEGRVQSLVELFETFRRDRPAGFKDEEELFFCLREELYGGTAKNS